MNAKETEFAKFEGEITDARSVVGWGPRAQGLDMYFRLRGSYAPPRLGSPNGDDSIQVKLIDTTVMRGAGPKTAIRDDRAETPLQNNHPNC
jgi:hypothetical protein